MAELTETDIRERVRDRYAAAARGAASGTRHVLRARHAHHRQAGQRRIRRQRSTRARTRARRQPRSEPPWAVASRPPWLTCTRAKPCSTSAREAARTCFLSARRVGPTGKAIGLDMTDEMLALARTHAAEAGVENVEFLKGYIEEIPLPDESVDVVISNCVINLSADKGEVLREAARVLRPGGRLAVSDVIADADMDAATRADMEQWTGCVAGALTRGQFEAALADAGLVDLEIRETHRVHEHASSAIVRARKPS